LQIQELGEYQFGSDKSFSARAKAWLIDFIGTVRKFLYRKARSFGQILALSVLARIPTAKWEASKRIQLRKLKSVMNVADKVEERNPACAGEWCVDARCARLADCRFKSLVNISSAAIKASPRELGLAHRLHRHGSQVSLSQGAFVWADPCVECACQDPDGEMGSVKKNPTSQTEVSDECCR
jgi:hypothetical protein